jgi:hypothetical protein
MMKTHQRILATILLALVLGIPAYAGDMGGPSSVNSPTPLPTDGVTLVSETPTPTVPGDSEPPAFTLLALNFLVSALSMH